MDSAVIDAQLEHRKKNAEYIASTAESLIIDLFHRVIRTSEKTPHDFVSQLDSNIEEVATKAILEQFPDDGIFGEEYGVIKSKNGFEWVIDPIDGTNNYLRGLPLCGFQLAIVYNEQPLYTLIHRPFTQEVYTATKGQGAHYRNMLTGESRLLKVSDRPLSDAISIFDAQIGKRNNLTTNIMLKLSGTINMIRVFGVAAFDLPAVAEGSVEFLVTGVAKKYDIAAGLLLIEEAGGTVYGIDGTRPKLDDTLMVFNSLKLEPTLVGAL